MSDSLIMSGMRDQLPKSAAALVAADSALSNLQHHYELGRQDKPTVARLHQQINYQLKVAEVAALQAIAQRLDDLAVSR